MVNRSWLAHLRPLLNLAVTMKEATGDIERNDQQEDTLTNDTVHALTWKNLHVEATASRNSPHTILSGVDGLVSAGTHYENLSVDSTEILTKERC